VVKVKLFIYDWIKGSNIFLIHFRKLEIKGNDLCDFIFQNKNIISIQKRIILCNPSFLKFHFGVVIESVTDDIINFFILL